MHDLVEREKLVAGARMKWPGTVAPGRKSGKRVGEPSGSFFQVYPHFSDQRRQRQRQISMSEATS